ncbi:MAG: UbiA family prenyltransferase [Acidobacteriota bacterium]
MSRRSKLRAYLLLARISNLPTVWTNVLAGSLLAGAVLNVRAVTLVALAMSLIYSAGMWMNDACDAGADARARADRPIPRGDVTLAEVWAGVAALVVAGAALLWLAHPLAAAWPWSFVLLAAIAYYNVRHKRDAFGPLAMGICRGLLYVVSASAVVAVVPAPVWFGAAVMILYVLALTLVGKTLGPRAGGVMPWLIAGISLVDALIIVTMAPGVQLLWVMVAVLGFIATLAAQRVVPGT